ncbi:MAG: hypothetical protein ACE5HQ_10605 [Gemmatimonadota bacterium]
MSGGKPRATRYWFGRPGSETVRIHPFVGTRLGYADYVGDGASSGGVQVDVAGGASYRLAGPLGLMGSVALDGLGFSDRRLGSSGRGFFPESVRSRLLRSRPNRFPAYRATGARITYVAADLGEVRIKLPLNRRFKRPEEILDEIRRRETPD